MIKVRVSGQGSRFGPGLIERVKERLGRLRTIKSPLRSRRRRFGQSDEYVVRTDVRSDAEGRR